MMATPAEERDAVLEAIATWPIEAQVSLARAILERAAGARVAGTAESAADEAGARSSWEALYGIASGGQEAPSDAEVDRWLDEHRTQKYGE